MKNDSIFDHEQALLLRANELLDQNSASISSENYEELISEYKRLLKTTSRLVRHNDRNEQRLNDLAKEANEKRQQLEGLSKQLSKYLSPQVYQSIFSGEKAVSVASTRKKLTIFFSDLVGFTTISENLQSEDLTGALNFYLNEMSTIALDHGATIDKYIGDAIMMFFGDPETQGVEEDAYRCVSMAVEMRQRLLDLESKWGSFGLQEPLKTRTGISTGYCTVGNFGSDNRLDYTVIGAGVNMASRLESAAPPGDILLSFDTYNAVKDRIPCEECDKIALKGIQNPVRTFKVLGDEDAKNYLQVSCENTSLRARIDRLSDAQRYELEESLRSALEKIASYKNPKHQ